MKIGIDGRAAKWYRGTGIGTYTHELLDSLNKSSSHNDYLIFLPKCSLLDNFKNNFKIESINANLEENFWDQVHVPNILDNKNIELYHVPQNGVGLSPKINCKKVITLHDIIPLKMPQTVSDKYLKIFNEELPSIINSCDGIITVSNFSKNDISKEFNFPKDKIFVTPLAAENIYRPLNKETCKNIIKSKYKINDDFILYVGGFSPRKNILGLIEAFSLIPYSKRKNTKLVITGKKGISYDKYKKRTSELKIMNDVIFTGFISLDHMPIFYNASKLLVYPSFYEGFGLPPLEAMACGTPVIASNVTSLPEVCGTSAILIDPYNIDELSLNIEKILTDKSLYNNMSNRGIKRSLTFSWDNTASQTLCAYENILKNHENSK